MNFTEGDFVTRRSYGSDIIFKIEKIIDSRAILRSYRVRLMADASLDDLVKIDNKKKNKIRREIMLESYEHLRRQHRNLVLNGRKFRKETTDNPYREKPGTILHIDGDQEYLEMSLQNYNNLQLEAQGLYIPEKNIENRLLDCLKQYRPDILVLTGHDGFLDGRKYHTSKYFIKAVKLARTFERDLDELVIFAGACQSSYKELISCGANFASSPKNNLIHFLDPILVVEKIAYTSIREVLQVKDIVKNTITGEEGIGGIETRGKLRLCYP